jgi:pimeloyl-ACP methyl ester carboxylesterase
MTRSKSNIANAVVVLTGKYASALIRYINMELNNSFSRFARLLALLTAVAAFAIVTASPTSASPSPKPTIVLVHGAFADGSCWNALIPLLQTEGFTVIAVQNALASYADDVTTIKRVIAAQKGSVVLVGHSYGGALITGAATGSANVKMLVYVAAFAPDEGETLSTLLGKASPSKLASALVPDAAGFLFIEPAKYREVFAADLSASETQVMAATQRPLFAGTFEEKLPAPGWKTIPSWYVVATKDEAIPPDLERMMAKRIGAKKLLEVNSSHVVFISHAKVIAKFISDAAETVY